MHYSKKLVFTRPELQGKNIAIITHAGGPGVMLTDALAKGNMDVPHISGEAADELLGKLFHGSSVANPIDFLATGTAEHLGMILDYVDQKFDNIDGAAVIFGTTGLFDVTEVYDVLDEKMNTCKKPIYPILPSIVLAADEVEHFVAKGRNFFPDEVELGNALARVYHTDKPEMNVALPEVDKAAIRKIIDENKEGYISPESVQALLDAAGIPRAAEIVVDKKEAAVKAIETIKFPLVMKVVGPVHKSDVGGVALNIKSQDEVEANFEKMMQIKDATAVLMQPMLSGQELFVGASYEDTFGHLILAGMGGIFIEVLKDVSNALSPVSKEEATKMITSLKSYKMIEGVRGQEGVNQEIFADIICRLSALLEAAPEIKEMDLNPLLGKADQVIAVDARVRIEK
jgi:acetyltransferase